MHLFSLITHVEYSGNLPYLLMTDEICVTMLYAHCLLNFLAISNQRKNDYHDYFDNIVRVCDIFLTVKSTKLGCEMSKYLEKV